MKRFYREVVFSEDFELFTSSNILLSKKSMLFHLSEYMKYLLRNTVDEPCKLDIPINLGDSITLLYSHLINGNLYYRGYEEFRYY